MKKPRKPKSRQRRRAAAPAAVRVTARPNAARYQSASSFSALAKGLSRRGRVAFEAAVAHCETLARRTAAFEAGALVDRLQRRARAVAAPYSADDRELAALLFLPVLLFASAMVISQSIRRISYEPAPVALEAPSPLSPAEARRQAIAALPSTSVRPIGPALPALSEARPGVALEDIGPARDETLKSAIAEPGSGLGTAPRVAEPSLPELTLARPGPALEDVRPDRGLVSEPGVEVTAAPSNPETLAMLAPGFRALLPPVSPPQAEILGELETGLDAGGRDNVCRPEAKPQFASFAVAATSLSPEEFGLRLAQAAQAQVDGFVIYNDKYRAISYPNGDVPSLFGVCTDVIVRAYRALGIDLQARVQEARAGTGDRNIDHRRTEVLRRFFAAKGESLPISSFAEDYRPGDIVTYYRPQNSGSRSHIAIVSAVIAPSGRPMIIHNRGWGPQLEDGLFVDQITGHYRYTGAAKSFAPAKPEASTDKADATKALKRKSVVTPASY